MTRDDIYIIVEECLIATLEDIHSGKVVEPDEDLIAAIGNDIAMIRSELGSLRRTLFTLIEGLGSV